MVTMVRALHPRYCFAGLLVYSFLTIFTSMYHSQGAVSLLRIQALVTESVLLDSPVVVQNKEAATKVESQVITPKRSLKMKEWDDSNEKEVAPTPDETKESESEPEKVSSKSKSATNAVEWQEPEEAKTSKYVIPSSVPGATVDMPDGSSTFSSCLMVMGMSCQFVVYTFSLFQNTVAHSLTTPPVRPHPYTDDNHRLVEWIAYHYFVMNLRYLVILPDRFSRYSPKPILDKWRKYMVIDEWKDEDFMDEDHKKRAYSFLAVRDKKSRQKRQQYHMERQAHYYRYCALHMQAMNRTWVSFHDVDEYYVINSEVVKNATERMREPGSVLNVLNQVQSIVQPLFNLTNISISEHHLTSCVTTYRLQYSAVESTEKERRQGVPDFIDPKLFETLRWRHYTPPNVMPPLVGKSLLDVSKIADLENKHYVDRPLTPFSPHRIIPMCSPPFMHKNSFIRVNHYIGSWEYYSFRTNDIRKGGRRSRDRWKRDSAFKGGKSGDEIRPWIDGFVHLFGENESKYLLEGSGLGENYTATIDRSWVLLPDQKNYWLHL
jgi:hypothetical protein